MPPANGPPLHVLLLLKGLSQGGAESLVLLAIRHRRRITPRVGYISAANDNLVVPMQGAGAPVTCLAPGPPLDPRWLWKLRKAMTGGDGHPRPQVVHAHSPVPAVGARLVARTIPRRIRPAVVTTEHNTWESYHPLTRRANSLTFGLSDAHLAVSEAVRSSLPPQKARKVEVSIQGVNVEAISAQADRAGARKDLGVGPDEVLIGTVANLRPSKAYPDLLRAARIVIDHAPNVRFVSAGQGPLDAELRRLHAELELGDRFRFLGYRPDAVRLISGFDIFCLASHHEGLPVSLMEAMVLGVPTVATRAGGVPEILTNGVEGHLVPPGRPRRLAKVLIATATDDAERRRLSKAAALRGDTLSVESSIRRTEDLYASLVDALPPPR